LLLLFNLQGAESNLMVVEEDDAALIAVGEKHEDAATSLQTTVNKITIWTR